MSKIVGRASSVTYPLYPIESHQVRVQFLFTTPSLRFLAHEARQRCKLWKNTRGIVAKA